MKTVLISAIAFAGLAGAALAQEAPMLIGDYSANVEQHTDAGSFIDNATVTSSYSVSTMRRDGGIGAKIPCVQGNYGPNVTCDGVHSGR